MAGSLTISISSLSALNIGSTKNSEVIEITEMVQRGLQVLATSKATSTTFKDRSGNVAGTISWTPANSAA